MSKNFDTWNSQKKSIADNNSIIKFQQMHIVFMKIGANIGYEQDGKGDEFLRPVLVFKKFNNRVFLGIPLTSKIKHDKFHFEFEYKKGKKSFAILSQLKLFDIKRAKYYDGRISKRYFELLQEKLLNLIVTPLTKEGECTKAICKKSISQNNDNVKYNILVTGSNGQLGSEVRELSKNYTDNFYFTDRDSLDITDKEAIFTFVNNNNIDVIINCGAYTAVDKAEAKKSLADEVNRKAVKKLAKVALKKEIKLIHISTDYVFNGRAYKPYQEMQQTDPKTSYGKSKLDGELEILKISPKDSIIIRTSWVYSSFGSNFVKTMLKLGRNKKELGVIYDQVGTPTYAKDLAQAILDIIPKLSSKKVEIYHYSNEGVVSWYDFAKEIMKMAKLECSIKPIESKDYPTPAQRPHYSLLNKSKIKKDFDIMIPYWKDSLKECLGEINE